MAIRQLHVSSEKDSIELMAKLRGLKIGKSKIPLRSLWPVEMDNRKRKKLLDKVSKQMTQLNRKGYGGFYDRKIEDKKVTYRCQADAIIALICLDQFEICTDQPINIQFEGKDSKFMYDEVFRIRNLIQKQQNESNLLALQPDTSSPLPSKSRETASTNLQSSSLRSCSKSSTSSKKGQKKDQFANTKNGDDGISQIEKIAQDSIKQKIDGRGKLNKSNSNRNGRNTGGKTAAIKIDRSYKGDQTFSKNQNQGGRQDSYPSSSKLSPVKPKSMISKRTIGSDCAKFSVSTKATIEEEYTFSDKAYFLMQKINLEQRIKDKGYEVSFTFRDREDGGKLLARMIDGSQSYIMKELFDFFNLMDSNQDLPTRICKYLAQQTEMTDSINKKLIENGICAVIIPTNTNATISVIAKNATEYEKVTAVLLEIFDTKSTTVSGEAFSFPQDTAILLSSIQQDIAMSSKLLLEAELNDYTSSCTITVTGPRNNLHDVIRAIQAKLEEYKLIKFDITDTPVLKTEYLRTYLKDNIRSIEKIFGCRIEVEAKLDSDSWLMERCKNISISCYQIYKNTIENRIRTILRGITVQKEDGISKYSLTGRLLSSSRNKARLQRLQEELHCLIAIAGNKGESKCQKPSANPRNAFLRRTEPKIGKVATKGVVNLTQATPQTSRSKRKINNVAIKLVKGRIEQDGGATADVIVNSVSTNNFSEGKIAAALFKAGGTAYQQECRTQLQFPQDDSIGSTNGQYFGCKKVYHIPFLTSDRSISWLILRIEDCLRKADRESMRSIAIPIIGTGQLKLDVQEIARKMTDTSVKFAYNQTGSLREIYFMVFPTDTNVYNAFEYVLELNNPLEVPLHHQTDLLDKITKSTGETPVEENSYSALKLLFSARYDGTEVPISINVYHGNAHNATTDAIIDVTSLCAKHSNLDSHLDIMRYSDSRHTSQTLRILSSKSRSSIYQVCPYGCLPGFGTILAIINAREQKSITIPLLSIEINISHVYRLIGAIETFLANHLDETNYVNCFNFVIGYEDRSQEFATWVQMQITNKSLQFGWQISQHVAVTEFGLNIIYVAEDQSVISKLKSKIEEYADSWICHKMKDEDYFNSIDQNRWNRLVLQFWSEYNTILVKQDGNKTVCISGLENDILNAILSINKLSQIYFEEKAYNEVEKFAADSAQWHAKFGQSRTNFDVKLNYEIEKNYKTYTKDKTKKIFQIDATTKTVDFGRMLIRLADGTQCSIGKLSSEDFAIPDSWENTNEDEIKDGYFRIIDVKNQREINSVSNLPGLSGYKIRRLQRIQNWNLYRRYQIMKTEVATAVQKYKPGAQVERQLFHGTSSRSVTAICKSGFDRDFSGTSAGSGYGTGTYFAVKAHLSQGFGDSLLLVRVLTGIYGSSSGSGRPNLSIIPGSQNERIHSVVDNTSSPSMYVVSNDNSAYPEYIIHL
ncbi:uncharacterized protein TRIADDRAFT_58759 [Trichoplax adhaerens]|uniref:Poly [ADP-ribose] polymerase n=1 Tax=Trichoplax adhaerens TaxID=10228 RepID=B3S3K8_TRIAD|nr:hypothetical protein TRIADDRAFT_58759 [Trichoplax adhaerens]EDV22813.1 hypothetical protein TRIADDRAFT_58759 [Trichoplax adhaerens]|eukprot:XP_002114679.1 hypothetical protein TRIADDRAFT_58759 [Trichoplax adhaerens]